jgi:hypothetical protein
MVSEGVKVMMAKTPERMVEHGQPESKDKPEQLVHGVKTFSSANVGTVIDAGPATITQILYTGAPTSYDVATFDPTGMPTGAYLCLVDQGFTPPRIIYNENIHVGGGHSPHATHKVSGYTTSYTGNLYLQSCPTGATFSLTTA